MRRVKLAVVADSYTSSVFRLLGAEVYVAENLEEARDALRKLTERADVGLALVAAEYYEKLQPEIDRLAKERPEMIVAKLPTMREKGKPLDVQRELLKALGMG